MELIPCRQRIHQHLYVVPGNPWECSYPSYYGGTTGCNLLMGCHTSSLLITTTATTEERQQAISDCHWLGVTLRAADDLTLELVEYILELTLTQLVLLSYLSVL